MSAIKVLDGGFSTQLSTHVGEKIDGDPLWTARFLATNPKAVVATHLDFLRAGADIIETNTYQASIDGFIKYLNVTKEESLVLFQRAVSYARQAVDEYKEEIKDNKNVVNPNPLVAGSVGPYGAAQHDGSEYTGAYAKRVSIEVLKEWHRPHIRALIDSGVDILALETIPCKHEAEALIDLLKEFPETKAWLTFSCRDDGISLAEGSNFQETAIACYKSALPGQLVAVGVNCIAPKCVSSLFKGINKHKSKDFVPLIVYPNSGEKYTVAHGWKRDGEWYPLEQFIGQWLDLGVRYVGGCCRTYATDVKRIRAEVSLWQEKERESIKKHASEEI